MNYKWERLSLTYENHSLKSCIRFSDRVMNSVMYLVKDYIAIQDQKFNMQLHRHAYACVHASALIHVHYTHAKEKSLFLWKGCEELELWELLRLLIFCPHGFLPSDFLFNTFSKQEEHQYKTCLAFVLRYQFWKSYWFRSMALMNCPI